MAKSLAPPAPLPDRNILSWIAILGELLPAIQAFRALPEAQRHGPALLALGLQCLTVLEQHGVTLAEIHALFVNPAAAKVLSRFV